MISISPPGYTATPWLPFHDNKPISIQPFVKFYSRTKTIIDGARVLFVSTAFNRFTELEVFVFHDILHDFPTTRPRSITHALKTFCLGFKDSLI